MIVKHETRIRTLETKNKEQEKQLMSQVWMVLSSLPFQIFLNEPGRDGPQFLTYF